MDSEALTWWCQRNLEAFGGKFENKRDGFLNPVQAGLPFEADCVLRLVQRATGATSYEGTT